MLAARLKRTLVLNGDGTDLEFLESENVGRSDVLVCVIDNDERNLLASLLGRQLGVPKIVTRVSRPTNLRLFERVGIDVALSARAPPWRRSFTRSPAAHRACWPCSSTARRACSRLTVSPHFVPKPLKGIGTPGDAIVGAILRGGEAIVPRGDDRVEPGDRIIVFSTRAGRGSRPGLLQWHEQLTRAAMRLSLVTHVTGLVVRVFGLMFLAPLVVALALPRVPSTRSGLAGRAIVTVRDRPLDAARRRPRRRGGGRRHAARRGPRGGVDRLAADRRGSRASPTCGTASARSTRCSSRCRV